MSNSNDIQIQLFAWGDNSKSSCGLPTSYSTLKTPTTVFKQERNKPDTWLSTIRQMCTGKHHSLFLTVDGKVLGCGDNEYGQCGLQPDQSGGFLPRLVRMPKRVTCISAGADHSVFVMEDGTVTGCGLNSHGQLGRTEMISASKMSSRLNSDSKSPLQRNVDLSDIIWASCGENYTIFLTKNEELLAVGDNSYGQLGCGTKSSVVKIPQKVLLRPRPGIGLQLKKIRAGSAHTLYLTHDGYVFVCGSNEFGQLGFSADVEDYSKPTLLPPQIFNNLAILDIACGLNHSVFLTQNHSTYVCGSNVYGECGLGGIRHVSIFQPVLIPDFYCKSIHCGALHSFFLKRDNTLWGCGRNDYSQVGTGENKNETSPKQIHFEFDDDPNLRITKVSCGFGHFSLVTKIHVSPQPNAPQENVTSRPPSEEENNTSARMKKIDISELDQILKKIELARQDINQESEHHKQVEEEFKFKIHKSIDTFQSFCVASIARFEDSKT